MNEPRTADVYLAPTDEPVLDTIIDEALNLRIPPGYFRVGTCDPNSWRVNPGWSVWLIVHIEDRDAFTRLASERVSCRLLAVDVHRTGDGPVYHAQHMPNAYIDFADDDGVVMRGDRDAETTQLREFWAGPGLTTTRLTKLGFTPEA